MGQHIVRRTILLFLLSYCIYLIWTFLETSVTQQQIHLQHQSPETNQESQEPISRSQSVKDEFYHAWQSYKFHGWMHDTLRPISGITEDNACGWAATVISSLDTLYIMGLDEDFEFAVDAIVNIDFEESARNCQINFLESVTRYLGGLLSAYDLSADERIKPKIVELGALLHTAFDRTTNLPCLHCKLGYDKTGDLAGPDRDVPLADISSFYLEFVRLWQVTGNRKYLDQVLLTSEIYRNIQNQSSIPGLFPERLDFTNKPSTDVNKPSTSNGRYSLGALSDSAYEYLVKTHLLLGTYDQRFAGMWHAAATQIKQNLLFYAYIPEWKQAKTLFAGIAISTGQNDKPLLESRTEHLACFAGGMFALSSRLFDDLDDLEVGRALAQGCIWAYETAPVGIMPETITLLPCPEIHTSQCEWNHTLWEENVGRNPGYPSGCVTSIDAQYRLRPDAIESLFVLYRITGEKKWQNVGWRIFTNVIEHTRAPYGHAGLTDVMGANPHDSERGKSEIINPTKALTVEQKDEMESFWLGATLKYFYLLFSDSDLISLDDYVFNTEAHPFKLNGGSRVPARIQIK